MKIMKRSNDDQWEELQPRGGKALDARVVAHTTVYYKSTNSLIVYGGVVAGVARFSKLSDRMFAFQLDERHWTEILYPRTPLRDAYIPRERAFHTSTIIGNYMIIFGGYSHRHNKEEICYDNQMYLYHLGCHTWINQDVLGTNKNSSYPKQQGVFAHAATVRNGNTLLIVGGYHGNVNADLLAYTLPPMLVVHNESTFDPEALCPKHTGVSECLSDPECGWCSADNVCYGRTIGANCTTNLQTTRCPGVCPALGDCHACLIHGLSSKEESVTHSVANKFGLNQCTWCVQNARCHHRDDNYGVCGEDTPSQEPGYWGTKGTEVQNPLQCTEFDRRPGLTFLKYLSPVNWTMPDDVTIVNATMVDFIPPSSTTHTEQYFNGSITARLLGFIRSSKSWKEAGELLHVCASYSQAILRLSEASDIFQLHVAANITAELTKCVMAQWPNSIVEERFLVDFQAKRKLDSSTASHYQHSKMGLQHNGTHENARAFTFEYLEPYSNGSCSQYNNCHYCLSDALCGWCELTNECLSRTNDEQNSCASGEDWRYLTLQPSKCANCSNYISCEQCVESDLCEWWAEDARCARLGRAPSAVRAVSECPAPCYERENCTACLEERGRCVWCEATQQCFSFSVYTSEYQFGLCREWLDQTMTFTTAVSPADVNGGRTDLHPPKQQCKSCTTLTNCSSCLQSLSCGWCFDRDNPIEGICMQGDFNQSTLNCGAALNTTEEEAEWAYAQCPDVDECGLGLHDCHQEAKCTNTHGSYNCHCRRGFNGDGRTSCTRTCYEQCVHGYCSASPDYLCKCDLGWTGSDCSLNCGCNNHSTCDEHIGKCDSCQNWTEGTHCERCSPGSFGNATSLAGCKPCECNGHGNIDLGVCDVQTGECYCQDNTEGLKCEMCNKNFYGDPSSGGLCFFQCESRGMLKDIGKQGIGSYQSHKNQWGPEASECLWIVNPHTANGSILTETLIQLDISAIDLNVTCGENAVYVYDGLPDLIGNTQQSQLLAVFCSEETTPWTVEARSGHLTVHFKQGFVGQGFNATYTVRSCTYNTCMPPHHCNEKNQCSCLTGLTGSMCEIQICPGNCSAHFNQGVCDKGYGRCVCKTGFGGTDCAATISTENIIITELFNSQLLSDSLEHLRKTLPRFGHSLVADKRGSLWMFGGYSLSHGPLNDIRQFDTKNNTWMQVTVDSTPEARMPQGRYFHGSDILHTRQIIFIYGGLTGAGKGHSNNVLGDFWFFSLVNQRWEEVVASNQSTLNPPPLAGVTMTLIKDAEHEGLLLVGGFSHRFGLHPILHEYNLNTNTWSIIQVHGVGPVGIYGHSTVFHHQSQTVYIFGGYEYSKHTGTTIPSNRLFAFDYTKRIWSLLSTFADVNRPEEYLPRARFLHSAITTDHYMLVFGGRTVPSNVTDVLNAYVYSCNQWVRLTQDVQIVGNFPFATYAQAMTLDQDSDFIYIVGGWDGSNQCRVSRITLPEDLCALWSSSKYMCRHFMGCSFCSVKDSSALSHCYSHDHSKCGGYNKTLMYNRGEVCDAAWIRKRNCSSFGTCTACLAAWPTHNEEHSSCKWCEGCHKDKCVSITEECQPIHKHCENDLTTISVIDQCSLGICSASDCWNCMSMPECKWTFYANNWMCVSRVAPEETETKSVIVSTKSEIGTCGQRCEQYQNCSTCLAATSYEGGFNDCRWSTQLNECISPSYQPMYCIGGVCGLVLTPSQSAHCPEPCNAYTQCATCLHHAHCGWCSKNDTGGDGICTEGSLDSPSEYPAASTCDIIYASRNNLTVISPLDEFVWYYVRCPPENECTNHHHNCDSKSQRCVDLMEGYECACGDGYKWDGTKCAPVCSQGCVRGVCVDPNVCNCDFGYVGANCSIQCQCNGHSNCRGPDKLDDCIECHNNTIGAQCDKCKPLFVGDPKNNGDCVPCIDYCNGHSDVCVSHDAEPPIKTMKKSELEAYLQEGPIDNAVCLRCGNQTSEDRCEGCIFGHFRGVEDFRAICRPCQCHGHGDSCDPVTGEKCNCGNNTESDAMCSASSSKNSAQQCWMVQCSKCRDSYAGNPTDGHQCYKQITVESKMCFDAKTIDECKKPAPLKQGQTVFFVVQPRFMNVDIRITVDVTQGELDLYMSPQDDSFVVLTNQSSGQHNIFLDNRYAWFSEKRDLQFSDDITPYTLDMDNLNVTSGGRYAENKKEEKLLWLPHIHDCHTSKLNGFLIKDTHAKDLSTYITLHQCNTLLRVYNLKNRLVLTLPQTAHNLSATRFFIALKASNGPASYGLIFFRQDQLHIDLFVFFSVFFSCFFLFLAVCVVAWKTKQAADVRRARRRHVVEMLHMAKRPFSSVTLLVGPGADTPVQHRRRGRSKQSTQQCQMMNIRPVAIEPTADGTAAVGTVFIRLPGKYRSPVSLALGSSLTIMSRNSSINSRTFLRRRGSNHAPAPVAHQQPLQVALPPSPNHP